MFKNIVFDEEDYENNPVCGLMKRKMEHTKERMKHIKRHIPSKGVEGGLSLEETEEGGGESETLRVYQADPAGQGGIRIYILIPSNELLFSFLSIFRFFLCFFFSFFFFSLFFLECPTTTTREGRTNRLWFVCVVCVWCCVCGCVCWCGSVCWCVCFVVRHRH